MQRKKLYIYERPKFWQDITRIWFRPRALTGRMFGSYMAIELSGLWICKKHVRMKEEPYSEHIRLQFLIPISEKLQPEAKLSVWYVTFKCEPHWTWNLKTTTTKKKHCNYIVEVTFKGCCLSTAIKHFKLPCIGPNTEECARNTVREGCRHASCSGRKSLQSSPMDGWEDQVNISRVAQSTRTLAAETARARVQVNDPVTFFLVSLVWASGFDNTE